jgi:amidase
MRGPHWADGKIEMRDTCQRAMKTLANSGAVIGELATPPSFYDLVAHQKTVMAYEAARARIFEYRRHRAEISSAFADLIEVGLSTSDDSYQNARRAAAHAQRVHDSQFLEFDIILAPAAAGEAPIGLQTTGDPLHSRAWTLLHAPCLSVPCGTGPKGLPMAVQLVGQRHCDTAFLEAASWIADRLLADSSST